MSSLGHHPFFNRTELNLNKQEDFYIFVSGGLGTRYITSGASPSGETYGVLKAKGATVVTINEGGIGDKTLASYPLADGEMFYGYITSFTVASGAIEAKIIKKV